MMAMNWLWRLHPACWFPRGDQGAVSTEYVVVVGFVGVTVAAAIAGLGPVLLSSYERARGLLICPLP